jgi:hypothetical protein
MRSLFVVVVLVAGAGAARAEPAAAPAPADAKETVAEAAARVWLAALIAPKGVVATPTKHVPLDYLLNSPEKTCRTVSAGRAATAAELGRVKKCVFDTWKALDDKPTPAGPAREWEAASTFGAFDRKYLKRMTAVAADATIVHIQYIGSGLTMNSALVVGKDGAIRAIWMYHDEFE